MRSKGRKKLTSWWSKLNSILVLSLLGAFICGVSQSREESSIADDWDERPHTIEEVKAMLQQRKEAAMKREQNLSQAFSRQVHYLLLCFSTLNFSFLKATMSFVFTIHELTWRNICISNYLNWRYGGLVGAHQLVMKKSLKRDQNG